jgi:diguanylate cyclase
MPREIAESRRNGTPMCLALVDIDHFKVINDTFGHPVGDDVLRFFAALLAENVKGRDLAARYGGEEFALILPATAVGNAQQLVQQIMDQLKATNLVLSQGKTPIGRLTASFGIAQLRDSDDSETLLMRADTRLYEAKNAGRNRIASDA